jgi:hypothetical protein
VRRRTSTSGLLLLLIGVLGLSLFLSPDGAWDRAIAWLFSSSDAPPAAGPAPVTGSTTADRRAGRVA